MSAQDMEVTAAFVAAIKKIEHGVFVNDLEIFRKIRVQKSRERTKCGCEIEEEAVARWRPKPVIAVVRVNRENLGAMIVKPLPVIYYSTHFASAFLPYYDVIELPIISFNDSKEYALAELETRFASIANIVLVEPKHTYDEVIDSDVHFWSLREQVCKSITYGYKRDGLVLFSFFKVPNNIGNFDNLSCYFKTSNRSLGTAPWSPHRDRLVHSTLNRQVHTFTLQVFSVPEKISCKGPS